MKLPNLAKEDSKLMLSCQQEVAMPVCGMEDVNERRLASAEYVDAILQQHRDELDKRQADERVGVLAIHEAEERDAKPL